MRGILILCGGSGSGRRGYGQRRERGWPEGVRPTRGGGRRKRRRWQQRRSKGRHQRDTDGAAEGCAGRSGVREGRRDAGTPGRRDAGAQTRSRRGVGTTRRRPKRVGGRVRAVPEGGDTGSGGSVGGRRGCGQPEGSKKEAAEAWRGLRKGTAGVSGAQERGGRRECGRPERVGKRKSERGQGRRGPGGGPQQVNRRSPWGRKWRSRS